MHQTIIDYCLKVKAKFPGHFKNVRAIDFGSLDVNGNNNYLFEGGHCSGVDIVAGDNVACVCKCHEFINFCDRQLYKTIISTQMLEHDEYWKKSLLNMHNLLSKGGLLLLTWAAPGFGKHSAYEGQYDDTGYYYEPSETDFRGVLNCDELFSEYEFELNKVQKDLCFWGIKK